MTDGKIELDKAGSIHWNKLTGSALPKIPMGSTIEFTIMFDENEFISGKNGIVWATYDRRQAEIICSALMAIQISTETKRIYNSNDEILLIKAANNNEIEEAIEFIWKSESGLRLKPDWSYPEGEKNKSFEHWLSGQ